MKRLVVMLCSLACVAGLGLIAPKPASAQVSRVYRVESRQSLGFNLGYFGLRSEDSRVDDDVLFVNREPLAFEIKDFNFATIGGEWLYGVSEFIDVGAGIGYYQRTVPTLYRHFTHADETEIEQDQKLRIIPMTATVRFLPIGRGGVEPYVGAGIGFFNWRYSEVGEFVDFTDDSIFSARFRASGNSAGPVILGGVRVPVSDVWLVGGELRYQKADATIENADDFLSDRIDLGGWTTSVTFHLRF